ncbi:hypothetical protein L6452_28286 [Arctium lappa]|uniref:Uncharacterized protein n=1 Tax=Arctium lappa TaxID=4217 RepID=A0ACB8ZY24_ARCLA|nr:hypothetical protein L6452_28286 [Arctium lappa]
MYPNDANKAGRKLSLKLLNLFCSYIRSTTEDGGGGRWCMFKICFNSDCVNTTFTLKPLLILEDLMVATTLSACILNPIVFVFLQQL